MHAQDAIHRPTGHFILEVRRAGIIVPELCVDEPNLIVTNSQSIHAHLLGGDVTNLSVTKISFGTNGAAPAAGDTAITGAFTKTLDSHSYPAGNQVQFAFSLASGENNGMAILEFGLVNTAGTLYARKNRSTALNKASDISLSGTWTISF